MSSINPGMLMRTMRRDPTVVDQKLTRETVRRVAGFAVPHKRLIVMFLVFVMLDAGLVVINPLLVKHILDDGIIGKDTSLVVWLALAMGVVSILDADARRGLGLPVLAHRREPDLRPPHQGLRTRAADVPRLLHPHPDRCAGVPAQQRRDRCPARVHLDAVEHRVQLDQRGRRRDHDVRPELAGHAGLPRAVPAAAPGLALGRPADQRHDPPADGRQRRPRQHDDRAVQRGRRAAAQAVRPPRRGGREVRREGRAGPRPRHPHLPGDAHLHRDHDADPGAGHRAGLRHRRQPGRQRRAHHRHADRARHAAAAPPGTAAGPVQRARRRDDRAGQLRPRLRGARPALHRAGEARRRHPRARLHPGRVRPRAVHLPARRGRLARVPGEPRPPGEPRQRAGAARHHLRGRAGRDDRPGRPVGRRQDDDHPPRRAALRRRRGSGPRGLRGRA